MNEREFTLKSNHDGLILSALEVLPDDSPRAVMQFAHGMCEHKERFLPFMRFLAQNGIACVINDHRGHGKSVKSADDLGYFYRDGDVGIVEDLHQITQLYRAKYKNLPIILYGHSMGSLAVRAYCNRYDKDIDGLIVSGSPGKNAAAPAGILLIKLLSLLPGGDRRKSKLVYGMVLGTFAKRFPGGSEFAWLSVNEENIAKYEADPLCGFPFTLNGYRSLLNLMLKAYDKRASMAHDIPVLFVSGADDPCAPDKKGFDSAIESFARRGYTSVVGKQIPNARHEFLNEKNANVIMTELLETANDWIK